MSQHIEIGQRVACIKDHYSSNGPRVRSGEVGTVIEVLRQGDVVIRWEGINLKSTCWPPEQTGCYRLINDEYLCNDWDEDFK